ncbi:MULTISPECIES: hypothetical protein [unclassified Marinobacter]|uniref:hypothetical protein n=1 Tax=unclassified Marinobacter TaxID=83889 RepID=UPI001925BCD8|nr:MULTISPECIES: hypothetical protein [unclassified Marinobacter]MBL3824413.1 hypothetical protein [Marinobacter sp. MC3]MBL3892919.1 hypothetical protein [Marinobacter sp. MW3]
MNYTWPVKAAALLTFLATFLTFSTTGSAGWLNAHMEIYPDCTEALTLRSSELLDLTRNSELFVVMAEPESDGMDAILALRHGFHGSIFDIDILNDNLPLADQTVQFTGTVVRRDASIPERVLGRSGGDSFFFVLRLTAGNFLLHPDSFDHSRFPVCEALLEDLD